MQSFSKRWVAAGLLAAAVLGMVYWPQTASAEPKPDAPSRQKIVRARVDGATFLMLGDPLTGTDGDLNGKALPFLQQQGYRIISVHMTASAGVNPEQQAALIWLEKRE